MTDYTLEQIQAHFAEREAIDEYIGERLTAAGYHHDYVFDELAHGTVLNFKYHYSGGDYDYMEVDIRDIIGHSVEELKEIKRQRDVERHAAALAAAEARRAKLRERQIAEARALLAEVDGKS